MVLRNKLFRELFQFGIIGSCAAALHFSIVVFLVEINHIQPLLANVVAFIFAFQVSYWGNRYWTFSASNTLHRVALPKLFLVCSMGFMANESLFYVFLTQFHLAYPIALFLVLCILPLATFFVGKFWVFKTSDVRKDF